MSVRVADRTESKMSFVYETMNLCEIVSKVVANKPKKYKQNWGDKIIETSLEAWRLTQMANSIKNMDKLYYQLNERRYYD